jgi:hypothetical protein
VGTKALKEISGLVASGHHPGVLWVHNDGSDRRLFALQTNGQVVSVFKFKPKVSDLEDIALGPGPEAGVSYLYVGDIGDNKKERRSIQVVRLAEPDVSFGSPPKRPRKLEGVETLRLRYPDGPHDAEALLVDPLTGDIVVVTKEKKRARVYIGRQAQREEEADMMMKLAGEIAFREVSAGDISRDGRSIILRREDVAWVWSRAPGDTVAQALQHDAEPVAVVGPPEEPNGESIAWHPDGKGYYTVSEGKRQPIYLTPRLSAFTP